MQYPHLRGGSESVPQDLALPGSSAATNTVARIKPRARPFAARKVEDAPDLAACAHRSDGTGLDGGLLVTSWEGGSSCLMLFARRGKCRTPVGHYSREDPGDSVYRVPVLPGITSVTCFVTGCGGRWPRS